jgi:hypothetical protein
MLSEKSSKFLLSIIGIVMILGAMVRIFATKSLFQMFYMDHLWSDHAYFSYIYKVLGAFVLFTGVTLILISINIDKYQFIIKTYRYLFLVIGIVMIYAGIDSGINIIFYLPDFIFSFLLSMILFFIRFKKFN